MKKNSFAPKPTGTGESPVSNRPSAGLLSRAEVAHRFGVCPHTIQRLTRRGLLPALVFNKRLIRYRPEVVEAFIKSAAIGE